MESSHQDLNIKYQKLATEYAKIRSQIGVLKKAVLDEQSKNSELKDEIQSKDQALRKTEQEMESMSFRNTQMEKRVGFLQEELARALKGKPKGGSKSKSQESPNDPNQPIFDYELLAKIDENIQLHKKVSELEENHRREVGELKNQVKELTQNSRIADSKKQQIGKIDIISEEQQVCSNNCEKEDKVKEHLTLKINELIRLLQLADSKAVTFHSECTSLQNLLLIAIQKRKDAEKLYDDMRNRRQELTEELQLTKENYELQLSTLTEHLANMNEKLAIQKDTIDALKYELNTKGSKQKK